MVDVKGRCDRWCISSVGSPCGRGTKYIDEGVLLTIKKQSELTLTPFNGNHIIGIFSSVNTTRSGSLKVASSCVAPRRLKWMRLWKCVCSIASTALGTQMIDDRCKDIVQVSKA